MFIAKLKGLALAVLLAAGLAGSVSLVWALAAADRPADKADRDLLQGSWTIVEIEMGGKKPEGEEADRIKQNKVVVKGGTIRIKFESNFTLDPTKTPRQIDVEVAEGPEQERGTWKGIYQLKGDDLRICLSLPGGERPKAFATEEGVPSVLLTLKRDKDGPKK